MSDEYPKTPLPKDVFRIPNKEEAFKTYFKSAGQFPAVSKNLATPDTFLKRNLVGKMVDKLPGPVGKAVTAGALAGVALEKGISKLKSKKGEDAKSEIPSGEEVQGKSKGGYVKKPYRMYNGKF